MNNKFFELPNERQNTIINGALSVFSKNGYKKSSTDDIAKASGISKSLIFHYFGTKKELYLFLYDYVKDFSVKIMSQFHNYSETDFFKILADAQMNKMQILAVHPHMMMFLLTAYFEESPDVKPKVDQSFAKIISQSSDKFMERADISKFKDGIDAQKILNIIVWMSDGFMRSRSSEELKDLNALNEEYLSYLELLRQQTYKPEYL